MVASAEARAATDAHVARNPRAAGRGWPLLEYAALLVILGLAAYLRLARLEHAQFALDDSTLREIAWTALRDRALLLRGMDASLGIPNGPFQGYIVMLPMLVSEHPLAAYIAVALLNVVGVFLCWCFCRSYLGRRVALIATLLLAVNPWAVTYSRRLWGNDMTAPFIVLLIWGLCNLGARGRRRDSFLPFIWLAVVVQVYVVALVHIITAAAGVLLGWRRVRPLPFAAGALIGLALVAPYAIGTALPNVGSLQRLNEIPGQETALDLVSFQFAFHIVGSEGYQAFANHAGTVLDVSQGLFKVMSWLASALLGLGSVLAIYRSIAYLRRGDRQSAAPYVMGLVAIFLPPLLLIRHAAPVYPFYMLTSFPMQFVLMGVAVDWLVTRHLDVRPAVLRLARLGVAGLVGALVVSQLIAAQAFFSVIDHFYSRNDYGLPLSYTMTLARMTEEFMAQDDVRRLYILGGQNPEVVLSRVLRHDGKDPLGYDSANVLVVPRADAGTLMYLLADREAFGARPIVERFPSSKLASYTVPGEGWQLAWYQVDAAQIQPILPPVAARVDATWAEIARLDGYTMAAQGDAAISRTLTLNWTLLRDAEPQQPQFYLYLRVVDDDRRVYQRVDRYFYRPTNWRAGDRVSMSVDFPVQGLSPGRHWLLVGLFTIAPRGEYSNLPVVDAAGRDLGDGVRLGPLYIRPAGAPEPPHRLGTQFDGQATLEGYDVAAEPGSAERALRVALYWRGQARMDKNYSVFVHLLDAQGRLVAQHDGQPQGGRYPTGGWTPEDIIVDVHRLALPPTLAPGRYTVTAGLYDLETTVRVGGPDHAARFDLQLP